MRATYKSEQLCSLCQCVQNVLYMYAVYNKFLKWELIYVLYIFSMVECYDRQVADHCSEVLVFRCKFCGNRAEKKRQENGPIAQTLIFEIREWNCSRVTIPTITTWRTRAHNYIDCVLLARKGSKYYFQGFVSTQCNTSKNLIKYSFIVKRAHNLTDFEGWTYLNIN